MRLFFAAAPVVALVLYACGGDVKVDGPPTGSGAGGQGGSSNSTTTSIGAEGPGPAPGPGPTTVGPSVTTGPGCGCFEACDKLVACGNEIDCSSVCAQGLDPALVQCICDLPGCEVNNCVGSAEDCGACLSQLLPGSCAVQVDQCAADPACFDLVECHFECNFEPACISKCDQMHPMSIGAAYSVLQCGVCENCFDACADSAANTYCFLEGG